MRSRLLLAALPCLLLTSIATAKKDKDDYDIEKDHRYTTHFRATLDEGTWMSVDHHDGTLVFDLLGDLYTLPLEGGEATRVTKGPAWDQDPRFSPDGSKLLYVSDRGGNQEIWVRDVGAREGRKITSGSPERFSEATWMPDGRHIVARKRIVDTRSIGMCELWLFDIEGGDGVKLTDTGSQPFPVNVTTSTGGSSIYFSGTPWRFQYNRDPNNAIFDLYRMDLDSGETVRLTAESGGALAPQMSPDGRRISILRRVAGETRLEIYDVWDMSRTSVGELVLEHDNQEGFVLNGLYPHYDWVNESELVIWDDGHFKRVNVDSGEIKDIRFTAKVDLKVAKAHRSLHDVPVEAPVTAKSIRWPTASPDGRKVVFEAFGKLWIQEVGQDEARPLTDGRVRALAPVWHPKGDFIAYATWHDDSQGSVRLLDTRTMEESVLTQRPAQYLAPSFSPSGDELAWLRGSGAPMRGKDTGSELWYRVEYYDGRQVKDVMSWHPGWMRTERIGWSADGERLLLVGQEPTGQPNTAAKTVLKSFNLEGQDERIVARWKMALDVSVKPDGTQVAFVEGYRVYKAPLPPHAGKTLEFGPEKGPTPVTEVAQDAGQWLAWSGNRLTFGLGQDFTLGEESWTLNATVPRAYGAQTVAYTNARVLTMGEDGVLENATVVVQDGRIQSVGDEPVPSGATVIDVAGKTLMPGIIDIHAHLHYGHSDAQPLASWRHEANLAYGVTTTHDPSANDDTVFGTAERIEAGLQKGPRSYSTGFILYGAWSKGRSDVTSYEDALFHVQRKKAVGAVSVKSYQQPAREQRQWILQASKKAGLNVYPEGGGDLFNNLTMMVDGHTDIEHSVPQAPLYADAIGLWATSGTTYTPTLLVSYGGISGERYYYQTEDLLNDVKFNRFTPSWWVDANTRRLGFYVRDDDWYFKELALDAGRLNEAGVKVNLGGHGQVQGIGPHWELWAMAEGMGNLPALEAATLNGAYTLGMDADLGSIEEGKIADILVIDGRPDEDIRDSLKLTEVMKAGVRYDAETLDVL